MYTYCSIALFLEMIMSICYQKKNPATTSHTVCPAHPKTVASDEFLFVCLCVYLHIHSFINNSSHPNLISINLRLNSKHPSRGCLGYEIHFITFHGSSGDSFITSINPYAIYWNLINYTTQCNSCLRLKKHWNSFLSQSTNYIFFLYIVQCTFRILLLILVNNFTMYCTCTVHIHVYAY